MRSFNLKTHSQDEARYAFGVYAIGQDIALGTKLASMPPDIKTASLRLLANRGVFLSPENFATAFQFDKMAGDQIRECFGSMFTSAHSRYSQCRKDILSDILAGMDDGVSIKQAELRFPRGLAESGTVSMGNIISSIPSGVIRYALKKQASLYNHTPQYRDVVEAYALYKAAALCRFPDDLKLFGIKLAVWQNY